MSLLHCKKVYELFVDRRENDGKKEKRIRKKISGERNSAKEIKMKSEEKRSGVVAIHEQNEECEAGRGKELLGFTSYTSF